MNTLFFIERENYVRLASQDFILSIPIGPIDNTVVKEIPEKSITLLLPGTIIIFGIVNIFGFFWLEEH